LECNARNNNNQMTYLAVFPISQGLLRKLNIGTPLTQRPIYNMLNHGSAKQRLLAQGSTEVLLPWMERNQWQNRSLTCWTTDQACTEIQFQSCCLQNLRRMGLAFIVRWRGGHGLLWSMEEPSRGEANSETLPFLLLKRPPSFACTWHTPISKQPVGLPILS